MNYQTYIISVFLTILTDTILGAIKKSPPYLIAPYIRLWKETVYLHSLLHDVRFKQWNGENKEYIPLEAIEEIGTKQKNIRSILDILLDNIQMGKPTVLLGSPGSGKSTTLQVLTYYLGKVAYRSICFFWFLIILVATSLLFLSPILCLSWLISFILWEFIRHHYLVPVFIEPCSDYGGGIVTKMREDILTSNFNAKPLFGSNIKILWLIDGVNETPSNLYATFVEGWRANIKKDNTIRVIFSSRQDESPAKRLEIKNIITIAALDNKRVKEFIKVLNISKKLSVIKLDEKIMKIFSLLLEEEMLDDDGIGRNPYWLKMIIESDYFRNNRGMVFLAFAKKLILREIEERPDERKRKPEWKTVPVDIEMEALAEIALVMQKESQLGFTGSNARKMAHSAILEIIELTSYTVDDILWEANSATLLNIKAKERILFSHQLLQECFAAYSLRSQNKWNVIKEIDNISKWRGILITAGKLIEVDSTDIFNDFLKIILGESPDLNRILIAINILLEVDDKLNCKLDLVEEIFDTWLFKLIDAGQIKELIQCIKQEELLGDLQVADFMVSRLVENLDFPERSENISNVLVSIDEIGENGLIAALIKPSVVNKEKLVKIAYKFGESIFIPLQRDYVFLKSDVRHEIIGVLGRIQSRLALEFLVRACEGSDEQNLLLAAFMILNIHATISNFDIFIYGLENNHPFVRWVSCYALGIIRRKEAIPYLENLCEKENDFFLFQDSSVDIKFPITNYSLISKGTLKYPGGFSANVNFGAMEALQMISTSKPENIDNESEFYCLQLRVIGSKEAIIRKFLIIEYTKGLEMEFFLGIL